MKSLLGEAIRAIRNDTPVPFSSRRTNLGGAVRSSGGDREAQAAAYGMNGTLFAIVGGIAVDISAVEWQLWKKAKSGKPEDRDEVTSHAAIDVWNKPNGFMPRQEYVEVVQQHLDLTGEGWNLMSRAGLVDWPVELWPIFPHRMTPVPDPKKFVAGYIYTSPDGEKVPLETRDVGLLRQPHPLDMMRGLGAVAPIGTDLDTASAAMQWNRNFFLNSAEPGGIIEVEKRLDDDEYEEMVQRWREQHQGVANAHRVAVVEQGKWVDRKYTMRDMQFVELRGVSREAIREAYRYPTALLGDSKDVNRASAVAQEAGYAKNLLVPRLRRWKGFLNNEFLPAFGKTAAGLEFDFVSPVPADAEADNAERDSKATAAKTFVDAGWSRKVVAEGLALPAPFVEAEEDGLASPKMLADMVQSVYLGVDKVITWEEGRALLNRAGADLNLAVPPPTPEPAAQPPIPPEPVPADEAVSGHRHGTVTAGAISEPMVLDLLRLAAREWSDGGDGHPKG